MKTNWKDKIINLVKQLIRYKEYNNPPYEIEERKIQRIQSEHIFTELEKMYLDKQEEEVLDHIKRNVAIGMANTMMAIGAIKFETIQHDGESFKIIATTFVPEKL